MRKVFILLFISLALLSCQKEENNRKTEYQVLTSKDASKPFSSLKNSIFRSTLFPPDNRQIKGSGLCELIEELCAVTHLDASHTL